MARQLRAERFDVQVRSSRVRRGFPFRVTGLIMPADPDVGLTSRYLDDLYFTTPSGKTVEWLRLTQEEFDYLHEAVWSEIEKEEDYAET